jgi:FMN phosphatase YigB (HAD superfamily)
VEIEAHGILVHFPDCRISAADVGYLKPHPAIFQAALDQVGATPDEAVFVGDNPIADIAGAQGAGMRAILRVTTPAPPMLSGLIVPDAAINSLAELPRILDEWYPGWRE